MILHFRPAKTLFDYGTFSKGGPDVPALISTQQHVGLALNLARIQFIFENKLLNTGKLFFEQSKQRISITKSLLSVCLTGEFGVLDC